MLKLLNSISVCDNGEYRGGGVVEEVEENEGGGASIE